MDGQVGVVTGGSSGIGLGIARDLARAGARVAVWSRTAGGARHTAGRSAGLHHVACDVSREHEVEAALERTVEVLGPVDFCFTAAGVNRQDPSLAMAPETFRSVLRTNLEGTFLTLRAAARHMAGHGRGGSLVAVSSIAAATGQARTAHYAAGKAAVGALVGAAAPELARHGIRANAIVPGFVDTPMLAPHLASARFVDRVLPRVPAGRWGVPDDLGGLAVHLAGPASRGVTGVSFVVDGGYSHSWH
ncbi:SDR family NAD(P)-dependent oxidoreductase [Kitasatospora sp. NPDC056446]|uniref:SDR family NAD(P)-dependent oxidoreductase n=1 Tax=Kitasatospora sp. NPDC056446 TaxID=3345819 RepID=UPI0036A06A73